MVTLYNTIHVNISYYELTMKNTFKACINLNFIMYTNVLLKMDLYLLYSYLNGPQLTSTIMNSCIFINQLN